MKQLFSPGKLITILIILLSAACAFSQPVIISGGSENDIIGRIVRMPDDRLLAVIERNPDWGSGDLYTTFSGDDGATWGTLSPAIVMNGNQSTFSVVVSADDSVRIYYASDETGSYRIYTVASGDGFTWSDPEALNLGWVSAQSIYDPCVIVEEDGPMTMTYIKLGGGIYISHCEEVNDWDTGKTLIQNSAYRGRVCKRNDGQYLATYHRNIGGNQYEVFLRTSIDRINWTPEIRLTYNGNSHDPFCNNGPDGSYLIYYAAYNGAAYNICRRISADGLTWLPEEQITQDNTNNTQPAFFIEGYNLFLVWTHAIDYDTDNDIYFQKFDYFPVNFEEPEKDDNFMIYRLGEDRMIIEFLNLKDERVLFWMTDISGRIVRSAGWDISSGYTDFSIPVSGLDGIYIISIVGAKKQFIMKVFL